MKKLSLPGALIVLVALFFSVVPAARPAYNPAVVGADARWVVYADFNTLRESTVGRELIAAISQAQVQATTGAFGINVPKLLTTIGALTAYGTNLSSNPEAIDGTLIAQGTPDLRKIAESMLLQGTLAEPEVFTEVKDLPFPAYAIGDPKAPANRQTLLVVAFPPEPIVLVSKSKAQLLKAREVFRGSAPSLSRASSGPLTKLGGLADGAYLYAATVVPGDPVFPEKSPQARVLQLTNAGALALGERGPNTFAHLDLVASSDANAEKLTKILQGLTAVLSMAETSDQAVADFLKSTAVTQDRDTVKLRLAYSSAHLVQIAHSLVAQQGTRDQNVRATPPPNRPAQPITIGQTLAEWGAENAPTSSANSLEVNLRTVENVSLSNGMLITVGRAQNGAREAMIDRVEIVAANGGAPLVWRQDAMKGVGGRGTMWQFSFPGASGTYTVKVGYVNPPDSKAKFALSVLDPNAPASATPPGTRR
jgi:hypothetical protein